MTDDSHSSGEQSCRTNEMMNKVTQERLEFEPVIQGASVLMMITSVKNKKRGR